MNRKARKTLATLTLVLIVGLAAYAGALVSHAHGRTVASSGRVIHLGTIYVTPEDTPERAAWAARERHLHRYATRSSSGRRDSLEAYDGARGSI